MSKISHLDRSVVVLVEWATESFAGWAKLVGAYNVVTGSVMDAGLSEEGHEALRAIVSAGYKGWHDSIAVRQATQQLAELAELGQYDREVVLAYARKERGEDRIKRLYGILDAFDASLR